MYRNKPMKILGLVSAVAFMNACATTDEGLTTSADTEAAGHDQVQTAGGVPMGGNMPGSEGPVAEYNVPGEESASGASTIGEDTRVTEAEPTIVSDQENAAMEDESHDMTGAATVNEGNEVGQVTGASRDTGVAAAPAQQRTGRSEQDKMNKAMALNQLHHINQKEIAMAEMAKNKSENSEVKRVAERVLTDHQKLAERVKNTADQSEVKLHSYQPATYEAALMDQLGGMEGAAFDQAFMRTMKQSHETALSDLRKAQSNLRDPQLQALFREAIPSIQQHERMTTTGASRM